MPFDAYYYGLIFAGVVVVYALFVARQLRKHDAGTPPSGVLGALFGGPAGCFFCLVVSLVALFVVAWLITRLWELAWLWKWAS